MAMRKYRENISKKLFYTLKIGKLYGTLKFNLAKYGSKYQKVPLVGKSSDLCPVPKYQPSHTCSGSKHGSWMLNTDLKCFKVEREAYKAVIRAYLKWRHLP